MDLVSECTNSDKQTDTDAVLASIQDEIRRHRRALGDMGAFDKVDPLANVRQHKWVNSHLPIGWPVMPRGIMPKLLAYMQKVTRRLLRWYINPIIDQQNNYNGAVAEMLSTVSEEQARLSDSLTCLREDIVALRSRTAELQQHDEAQQRQLDGWVSRTFASLGERLSDIESRQGQMGDMWHALEAERLERLSQSDMDRLRFLRIEAKQRERAAALSAPAMAQGDAPARPDADRARSVAIDCFLLGAQYRNESQMASRLSDYDDLFAPLSGTSNARVLDIGAGRGDMVAHLTSMGIASYGIDIDEDAVLLARDSGRDVRLEDAFDHLATLQDGGLSAVVMIQVLEHLTPEEIASLIAGLLPTLQPGGFIVAETLNPVCLWSMANWYILDPTHRTQLHPQMLRFLFEQTGYTQVAIRHLHPVAPEDQLEIGPLGETPPGADELLERLTQNTKRLNSFLFGPQDYAIIARRPEG